jgi:hypothetical protein
MNGFAVTLLLLRLLPDAAEPGRPSLGGYLATNASMPSWITGPISAGRNGLGWLGVPRGCPPLRPGRPQP